ncbi:MAG: class I SAM-dependent methyltransferase [Candidatus Diapherotrites archaeon]
MGEEKQSAGELFDKRVEDYDSFVHSTVIGYDDILESLKQIAKIFVKTDKPAILDLGVGSGNSALALLEDFPNASLTGYDVSQKMVEKTRERFKKFDYTGVCDNAVNIGFENKFDLVISSIVLHHLSDEDKQRTYKKIFNALKVGGVFVLADVMVASSKKLNEHLHEKWSKFIAFKRGEEYRDKILGLDQEHHQYAALNDNQKFLQQAGFKTEVFYRNLNSAIVIGFK